MTIYLDPIYKKFWIRIQKYGSHFRASTNEDKTYLKFLDNLNYKDTQEEAQDDLDSLAKEQGWEVVTKRGIL